MREKASYISPIVFYSAICEQENIQLSIGELALTAANTMKIEAVSNRLLDLDR